MPDQDRPVEQKKEWQPIASCPEDGLFIAYEDGAMRIMLRERGEWKATALALDKIYGDPDHTMTVRETGVYNPTHWMPLPAPPTSEGRS